MITTANKKEFKEIFGIDFKYFQSWGGFDILGFERAFFKNSMDIEKSMSDLVTEKYGMRARELIEEFLKPAPISPTAVEIEIEIYNNTVHIGKVDETDSYRVNIVNGKPFILKKSGRITYPFAICKEGKHWTIDHLPSGLMIKEMLTKRAAEKLFKILVKNFSLDFANEDIAAEPLAAVKELLKEF